MRQVNLLKTTAYAVHFWMWYVILAFLASRNSGNIAGLLYVLMLLCGVVAVIPTVDVAGELSRRFLQWSKRCTEDIFVHLRGIKWALVSIVVVSLVGAVGTIAFIVLIRSGIAHGMY